MMRIIQVVMTMCFRPAATAKIKVCPSCGSANPSMRTSCIKCNTELELEEVYHLIDPPSYIKDPKATTQTGAKQGHDISSIIGTCGPMLQARKLARRFAESAANILLVGESGTGKELFAQAIHHLSRPTEPFMVLNCAAIPRNLIESELFGYDGGAFTGAKKSGSQGKIELAEGGTLFLDEIGDMPLETQAVLLRVLDNKQVMRVGGQKYRPIDFRLIAATNQDLERMVNDGVFRLDLYYRLSVLTVTIPPLRLRGRDILILAKFFLMKHGGDQTVKPQIDPDTQLILMEYSWPGNVRQLENAMIYALHVCDQHVILPEHLPNEITKRHSGLSPSAVRPVSKLEQPPLCKPIKQLEEHAIKDTLIQTGNNIALAASLLGVSKSTIYRKAKILGIK
jgi:transcriptional regulator with PAS, ATPase and Fis domain